MMQKMLSLSVFLSLSSPAFAAAPQPAIDACNSLALTNNCTFATPNGNVTGFCQQIETDLACVPDNSNNESASISNTSLATGVIIANNTNGVIPDTGQDRCYAAAGTQISCPAAGESSYGQDAQYQGLAMSYRNNNDGTVSDNVTGLMWQQSADLNADGEINVSDKLSYSEALSYCDNLNLAGYDDWRLPNIKQLYSLINFSGTDPSGYSGTDTSGITPFINSNYFAFNFGDTAAGERIIDAQYASSTRYISTTMRGDDTLFGVNFADGRIKGYGLRIAQQDKTFYIACNRGNSAYGQNLFQDNQDGSISDTAHGLMWAQQDSNAALDWAEALAWVEAQNAANYLGHNDWRLPNAKELQSLLDYSRSPDTTNSAAIDPLFQVSIISNENGVSDFPFYWSSTTHANLGQVPGANAVYVSFGRALGNMNGDWLDVHGAGAQRSDPKSGDPSAYPSGHGPQGDAIRIYNYARLVRDFSKTDNSTTPYFDSNSNQLHIPVVDAGDLGLYHAVLNLNGTDERYTPGFVFDIVTLETSSGTASANYASNTGILNIPTLNIGMARYQVQLQILTNATGFNFVVSGLNQLQ